MKLVYEHNDPRVIASMNVAGHVPPGRERSEFDPLPQLLSLVDGNRARQQAILHRTLIGIDPYPEYSNDGKSIQTVAGRAGHAYEYFKARGAKHFYLPEVGLFNWRHDVPDTDITGVVRVSDIDQARRLYDELWTWTRANDFRGVAYFDFSDWTQPGFRSATRELGPGKVFMGGNINTEQEAVRFSQYELAEYGRIIMGQPHSRPVPNH
jgi:hypothetical protein